LDAALEIVPDPPSAAPFSRGLAAGKMQRIMPTAASTPVIPVPGGLALRRLDRRLGWRGFLLLAVLAVVPDVLAQSLPTSPQPVGEGKRGVAPAPFDARQVGERLDLPISITWSRVPLRQALASLSRVQRLAIVRDRRVDPEQELSLAIQNLPLRVALGRIAAASRTGVSLLGGVAYFGPPETAARLRTVAALRRAEAERAAGPLRNRLLAAREWQWAELAEPRQLLDALAAEAGVKLDGAAGIPHDLWPAVRLPPLAWSDRLSLVLVQFDRTWELSESATIRIVPLPSAPTVERRYELGASAPQQVASWRRRWPEARIRMDQSLVVVSARDEVHEAIEAERKPAARRPATQRPATGRRKEVYTLSVPNVRLRSLLAQLAGQLELQIEYDEPSLVAAGLLDRRVSLQVKEASEDELLKAALEPAGLSFRRLGRKIEVFLPAKTP
jgi:hypothetical protein